jgi:molybdenum cofactor cytidylyltransferase
VPVNEHDIRLAAIILAAGPSSRLGRPKQLVTVGGESLVRRTARLVLELQPCRTVVVCGCEGAAVRGQIGELPVEAVDNPDWEKGMGASIACGVGQLAHDSDGVLIAVCDQWRLASSDLERLRRHWINDISQICVASWYEGKAFVSGPPVIFPGDLLPELRFVDKKRGARQVIDRHIERVEFVELPNAAWDLDRPGDLAMMDQR